MQQPLFNQFSSVPPSPRWASGLARVLAMLALLLSSSAAWAQLTGTKTIAASGGDYTSVAAAITALNTSGVGAGGVVFSVPAGWTETFATATAGQITLNSTSANPASVVNPVAFQKSGTGANPVLTSAGSTGSYDAVLSVVGTDYVTFSSIDVKDSGSAVEFGYALFRASATDGSQNISIAGATITLNKTNTSTIGVYSSAVGTTGTSYTASSAAGASSNNSFTGITVANSFAGINVTGATATPAFMDTNNVVGATAAGNTMTNLGGSNVAVYGVSADYQQGLSIVNNRITIPTGNTSTNVTGILVGNGSATGMVGALTISSNNITVTSAPASTSMLIGGIRQLATSALTTVNIANNVLSGWSVTTTSFYYLFFIEDLSSATGLTSTISGNQITSNTVAAGFYILGVARSANSITTTSTGTAIITGNTITGNTFSFYTGTAYLFPLYATGTTATIGAAGTGNGNTIANNTITQASSNVPGYLIYSTAATTTAVNNSIASNAETTASTGDPLYGYFSTSAVTTETLTGNTFTGLSIGGTGTSGNNLYGIYSQATGARTFTGNTISNLTSGTSGGTVYGAINGIYSPGGTTVSITQNKVYGLTAYNVNSAGAQGINIAGGTTVTAANNIVGGISVPNLSSNTALDGILVSGGTTVNLYYNTVFLNAATSSATNFGTSGIRISSTTPTATLIDNLVDNKSTAAGTGTTVALRWSAVPGTKYGSASNNNLYYSTGPLYSDGTSTYSTLATLKAGVTPRETVSVTEDVTFANNSTGASANYLHIAAGTSTYAESNGQIISAYATDYDNDARGPYTGATMPYAVNGVAQANGGGAAPDLGADEGDFVPKDVVTVSNTQYTQTTATVGQGAVTQLAASLVVTATGTTPSPKLTSLAVNLGSSTPADIAAVYLYTSTTATFSTATATLVPSTNTLSTGSTFTITATNGSAPTTGTTYYFVVYDIAATAGSGDQIATTIASATIGGTVYTPTLSGPAGYLSVIDALAGTYYIDPNNSHSNAARTYATFTAAVNDLNLRGTKANVIFDVAPGVTFLEGGALVPVITTSGTSAKTITFERDPDTGTFASTLADPILQPTGGAGAYDAALALAGGDYFTFTHLSISQPSASTALEYGIALFRASASNGAQSNTVQNCAITLSTANVNSVGIYGGTITSAGVAVATNSVAGTNSNNTIISNTVTGAVSGIVLNGYNNASYYDLNNSIGGVAALSATTGNTVSGFGVAAATSYGVYASYQSGAQLNNNTVSGSATGAAIYGIYQDVSTATDVVMSYNNVTLSEAGSFAMTGVYNNAAGAAGNSLTLSNNTVSLTNSAATPSATNGVYSATTASTTATAIALSGNLVTLNISNVTGSPTSTMAGVYNATAAGSVTLSNNKVTETATETGTGSYNSPNYGVWNTGAANSATGALALSGNVVSATASNSAGGGFGSSTLGFGGVYNTGAAANTAALNGNSYTFAITLGSTAGANEPVYGVYNSGAVTGALAMNSNILSLSPTVNATANGYTGGTYYGVYNTGTIAATGSLTMTGNQPSLTAVSGALSFAPSFYGVYNNGAVNSTSTTAVNLSNNTVANTTTLGAASSSAGFYGVSNGASVSGGLTLGSNTINATTTYGGAGVLSGVFYGIYNNGTITGSATFGSNNVLTTAGNSYRTTGVIGLLYSSGTVNGSQLTISGNTFGPASGTAATLGASSGSGAAYALFNSSNSSATVAVSGNTAQNLSYAGTGTFSGYLGSAAAAGTYSVTQNTLLTLSSAGSLTGISVAGNTGAVSSNKLAGLAGTAGGSVVTGIAVTAASTSATVQNNLIGNLTAPAATSGTAIAGINVSGGNAVNLYYNTVYLNASSASASFGSSGIYLSSTTPTVTLINNLIDNKSVAGTSGFTVALRRTAAAFTGYGSTSNYNLYYAGTPGTTNLLYYDGANSYQTLAALKAAVTARETRSQTEDVPFASTTGLDATFLHISPSAATIVESSGVVISSIATDYDLQARGPYTGNVSPYSVNGVAQTNGGGAGPDIGADEGDFVPQPITVQSLTYNRLNATVGVGATNQASVGLTVVASVGSPTLKLSSLNIALLLGTTTSTSSFTNPKLYLSPTSTFDINTATLLPTTGTPATAYTLALTNATQLFSGSNYFFLTYDVAGTAIDGDQVSSNITAATIGGVVYNSSSTPPVQSSGATGFLTVSGPLAGMYYIDPNALTNPARTYPTFTAAINDLNVRGLGAAITFEVAPGQTYLEGGSLVPVITATGTSTNTITFERDPNTAIFPANLTDPLLQPTGGTGAYDAALAVAGGDYITFSRLSISQPSASTALEYGVVLFRASASNGAQNNTVQNCTITLSNANANTKGIYSVPATAAVPGTTLTITAGGQNSNNKFLGNTITNTASGIYLTGYNDATVYDTGNSIGGTAGAATGNTVTNFGTVGTTVYGIYASYQAGALLNNNTVNNTAGSGTAATATLYGIYQDASTATDVAMSSNTVTLTQSVTATAAATYPVYGVYNVAAGAATNTATLSNNTVTLSVTANNSATNSGAVAAVYNNATSGSVAMSGNTTTETVANTAAGSFNGNVYGVINATSATSLTGALTMSSNTTRLTLTVSAAGGFGATSTPGLAGVYNGGTAANTAVLNNNAFTFATTIGGTAGVGPSTYGVFNAGAITASLAMTGNTVTATPTTAATSYGWNGGALYGVANTGAVSATAATLTLTGNTVTASPSLASTNAPYQSFYGVYNTGTVSGSSSAATLSSNNVTYTLTLPGTVAASSSNNAYGVYNSGTMGGPLTENGNTVVLTPVLTSSGGYPGSLYGVYNSGTISSTGTLTMNGNTASTAPALSGSGAYSGNACGLFASGAISNTGAAALTVNSNTVNITPTLSSTGILSGTQYGLYITATNSGSQVVSGNTVSASPTLSSTGAMSGAYVGIYNVSSGTVGGNQTVTGNTVNATSSVANASTLTGLLYGIYSANTLTGNQVITNNNVLTNAGAAYPTTAAVATFYNTVAPGGTQTITGNTVGPTATPGSANLATNSTSYLFYNNNAPTGAATFSNNVFRNLTSSGTGSLYGYYNYGGPTSDFTADQNSFGNLTMSTATAGLFGVFLGTSSSQKQTVTNNTFTNLAAGTASPQAGVTNESFAIFAYYGAATSQVSGNTVNGFTTNGSGALTGIHLGTNMAGGSVYLNTVSGLTSSGAGIVSGLLSEATAPVLYRNKVYGLSGTNASSVVRGISVTAGTTTAVQNNLVGTLTAPAATSSTAIAGLSITGGTTVNVYYNTVYLNASSSSAAFGTAGIYASTTPTLTLLNNLVTNTSTPGTSGRAVAYQRSNATLTTYAAASNTNLFYVTGTPSATQAIYYDGTTTYQTLADYKTAMANRDQASVSDAVTFLSTTGSTSTFLHLDPSVATRAEGRATPISGITDDFDGEVRSTSTPDIGADEFNGTPLPVVLTRFDAVRQSENAALSWNTASETDNKGFEVQVSTDGQTFRVLGFVAAATANSATAHNYAYLDKEAGKTGLRYYRLNQVDLSGKSAFSPVRIVDFGQVSAATSLTAMPNPFSSQLTLSVPAATATDNCQLLLTDASGRTVLTQQVTLAAGTTDVKITNLETLATGMYVLHLTVDGQVKHVKVVKE